MGYKIEDLFRGLHGKVYKEYSLKNHTWFKVGGIAEYLYIPSDVADLVEIIKRIPKEIPLTVIGAGSNLLVREKGVRGIIIKLTQLNSIKINNEEEIEVQSGALNGSVSLLAKEHNIGGLEFISGIPGSIGGGIAMNAGCFGGEFKDIIKNVTGINKNGDIVTLSNEECNFSYRKSDPKEPLIFTSCILRGVKSNSKDIVTTMDKIKEERDTNQPRKVLTGGSTFANPQNEYNYKAWQLIDKVGLRGYKIGGASFSDKHCNFIINDGTASSNDIEQLIIEAQKRIKMEFNIEMHPEIKIIGEKF